MRKQNWPKRDHIKNYFPLPNEIYSLGLSPGAVAVYGFLLRRENRETYQCLVSYRTIGEAVGMSVNTVRKYVMELEERGSSAPNGPPSPPRMAADRTDVCSTPSCPFKWPSISSMSASSTKPNWRGSGGRWKSAGKRRSERREASDDDTDGRRPDRADTRFVRPAHGQRQVVIINCWNQTHDESIDEVAVMLFLCDENKGELTEEQRTFAKVRKAEFYGSFALTILDSLLYQEMRRQGLVSGLEDFWSVIAPRRVTANPLPVPTA